MRGSRGGAAYALAFVALTLAWPLLAGSDQIIITFEGALSGTLPAPFRTLSSSDDNAGRWEVTRVGELQVLTQLALSRGGYRLAAVEGTRLEHLRVGVRLRVSDRGDQAAGVAWRVRDARNYYAARIDFKEREFVLHKFVNGNRIRLSRLGQLRLDEHAWHEIDVEHSGDTIRAWLNGIPVANDREKGSGEAGMVALWMPADSSGHFARLQYAPLRAD